MHVEKIKTINLNDFKWYLQYIYIKNLIKSRMYEMADDDVTREKIGNEWLLFNANSAIFQLYHGENVNFQ